MTRFGPRIEPITSPTPGGYANCYATDADLVYWTSASRDIVSHKYFTMVMTRLLFSLIYISIYFLHILKVKRNRVLFKVTCVFLIIGVYMNL